MFFQSPSLRHLKPPCSLQENYTADLCATVVLGTEFSLSNLAISRCSQLDSLVLTFLGCALGPGFFFLGAFSGPEFL